MGVFALRSVVMILAVMPSFAQEETCAIGDPACSSAEVGLSLLQVNLDVQANKHSSAHNTVGLEQKVTSMVDKIAIDASISNGNCPCTWSASYPCSLGGSCYSYGTAAACQGAGGSFCGSSSASTCTCTWNPAYPCSVGGQCWGYSTKSSCEGAGGQYCGNAPATTTTLPSSPAQTPSGSLSSDMQAVLDKTNTYRATHHASALTWSTSLAADAQSWADKCNFQHSTMGHGENLYAGTGSFNGASAVTSWYNEINSYDFNNPGFSMYTGHFTQLVWKSTTQVGCAVKICSQLGSTSMSNAEFLVCEYSPAGNYQGQYTQNVLSA